MAPKDKLLIFDLSSGWGPLCKFLNKPVPLTPFPHLNKKAELFEKTLANHPVVKQMNHERLLAKTIITVASLYLVYYFSTTGFNDFCSMQGFFLFRDKALNAFGYCRSIINYHQ